MINCVLFVLTDLLNTQSTVHLTDSDIIRPRQTGLSVKDTLLNLPRNSEVRFNNGDHFFIALKQGFH